MDQQNTPRKTPAEIAEALRSIPYSTAPNTAVVAEALGIEPHLGDTTAEDTTTLQLHLAALSPSMAGFRIIDEHGAPIEFDLYINVPVRSWIASGRPTTLTLIGL